MELRHRRPASDRSSHTAVSILVVMELRLVGVADVCGGSTGTEVSILVLMEVRSSACRDGQRQAPRRVVSILVVMEVSSSAVDACHGVRLRQCFNPCCDGSQIIGTVSGFVQAEAAGFNPCCDGSQLVGLSGVVSCAHRIHGFNPCCDGSQLVGTSAVGRARWPCRCFNPCCDGSQLVGRRLFRRHPVFGVSILVVMEVSSSAGIASTR